LLHRRRARQSRLAAVDPAGQTHGSVAIEKGIAALVSDRRIGMAMGILIERHRCTEEQASTSCAT
jgi:ANTAR domain-containing protein